MNKSFNSLSEFEFESLKNAVNYKKWIGRTFQHPLRNAKTILEVGSGIGQFTQVIREHAPSAKITALEPELKFHTALNAAIPDLETIQSFSSDLVGRRNFDTIVSVNVLEHIEDDVAELKNWHELLNPGGHACVLVPAHPEIFSPIDNMMGHYRRYTIDTMAQKMRAANLDIIENHYFNFVGYWLWLLNFKLLRQTRINPGNVAFYDNVLIHFSKFFDSIGLNKIKGQSLVCIARRR